MANALSLFKRRALLCCIALISGCAPMRDDTPPHAQIAPEQISLAADIHLARAGWPDAQWWQRYGDPQLDALIDRARAHSPTIAMTRSRVAQAKSQAELLDGSGLQIAAFALINQQRTSSNGFLGPYALNLPRVGVDGPWYTEGVLGAAADWSIDLWGKRRSAVDAALGVQNARAAEAAAAELDIAAGVAQLYFAMQETWQMLALLQQTKTALEFVVDAHRGKADRGLEAKVPLLGARGQALAVERQIAAAHGQAAVLRESLRALLGASADDMPEIRPVPLPPLAAGLPGTLSYELLARRADLQAMRWLVQSSFSQVDAAKAAFYPSFDIKALIGLDAIHLNKLFRSSSQQINLVPGLYLPIFETAQLNAHLRSTRAASDMLIEQYNQAVLDAVRDVAVSASRLQALDDERALQAERVEAVRFAQQSAEAHYQRGLASRTLATEARVPVLTEQMALLLLDGQRLAQDIALTRALGGGYVAPANGTVAAAAN
ncbi:putative outer membrane efflux protein MdtP [Caballeronia peredens]|nr:putative outer membrane efflux protein MdtP [Caballeronia peredens]